MKRQQESPPPRNKENDKSKPGQSLLSTLLPAAGIGASQEDLLSGNDEFKNTNEGVRHQNRELNELNDKMKLALNYAEAVLNTAHQPFLVLDGELHILRANPAFYKAFKTTPETTEGCLLYDLGDKQWDSFLITPVTTPEIRPPHDRSGARGRREGGTRHCNYNSALNDYSSMLF